MALTAKRRRAAGGVGADAPTRSIAAMAQAMEVASPPKRKPSTPVAAKPAVVIAVDANKCPVCSKTVYLAEQVEIDEAKFHKLYVIAKKRFSFFCVFVLQ
jgi:hypothetical protein